MTFDRIMYCYKTILMAIDNRDQEVLRCLNHLRTKATESNKTFLPDNQVQEEIKRLRTRIKKLKSQVKNMKEEIEKLKIDRRKKLLSIRELREKAKNQKLPKPKKNGPGLLLYNKEVNEWIDLINKTNKGDKKDD